MRATEPRQFILMLIDIVSILSLKWMPGSQVLKYFDEYFGMGITLKLISVPGEAPSA